MRTMEKFAQRIRANHEVRTLQYGDDLQSRWHAWIDDQTEVEFEPTHSEDTAIVEAFCEKYPERILLLSKWRLHRKIERSDVWMRGEVKHLTLGRKIYTKEALDLFAAAWVDGFIGAIRPAFHQMMTDGLDDTAPTNPELN